MGHQAEQNPLTKKAEALADPRVHPILKDLAQRVIPGGMKDELARMVRVGLIDPVMVPETQPILSPVSQIMSLPPGEAKEWLKILFADAPEKLAVAKCPCYGFQHGYFSADPDNRNPYYATELETPSLVSVLASRTETPVMELAAITPAALTGSVPDRYGNNAAEPLFHQLFNSKEFSVATFDKLEELCGNDDFLMLKNSRGETLFHRIASYTGWGEDIARLDVASWMLQRRPNLVNEPDRFGWTPLDRLVSQARGQVDTSMGRLLIVSGARLEKQIAPAFTLAAALEEHSGARLDKPSARKPTALLKPL